ncbi:chromosome segregation SMC domain protein [Mycobacterium kansasii]|uniref:Chromosome segregation SMC domain protein n=1 Tax=Mycobacterium kansasii TaxID=1768 RepID=A0A1V3XWM6_MYCKA|nr:chromosome segregation SMC domain protein [Mycobacterium kansasii]OOK83643.1 chromosome segregation SMC domain protein [Mycobacterium kansasii]
MRGAITAMLSGVVVVNDLAEALNLVAVRPSCEPSPWTVTWSEPAG